MNKKEIGRIVREVMKKNGLLTDAGKPKPVTSKKSTSGPAAMIVFHAGVRYLEKSLVQVRQIDNIACRASFLTATSACTWISGVEIKTKTGINCCLDRVKPEGLEKALKKADILVLPTFCFKTAAKVACLIGDTSDSAIVLSALMQGKKVLATCDSFTILETLANDAIRSEITRIQAKLESFGMMFCHTDELSNIFDQMGSSRQDRSPENGRETKGPQKPAGLKLITAKDIQACVDDKQTSIFLTPGGIVTPLAKDQAKEYEIQIIGLEH